MKVLGLLGGMSWESTVEYCQLVNEETRVGLGGLHSAPLVLLWSADFAEIEELQVAGRWDEAADRLAAAAQALESARSRGDRAVHQHHAQGRRHDRGLPVHPLRAHRGQRGGGRDSVREWHGSGSSGPISRWRSRSGPSAWPGTASTSSCPPPDSDLEIELLVRRDDTSVPLFLSTALHVRSALDAAMTR